MTIRAEVAKLLQRKRAMTYQQIVDTIHTKHPEARTSVKTVQWYASRLRVGGSDPNVLLLRPGRKRRDVKHERPQEAANGPRKRGRPRKSKAARAKVAA